VRLSDLDAGTSKVGFVCEDLWRATVAVLAVVVALELWFRIDSLLAMVFWFLWCGLPCCRLFVWTWGLGETIQVPVMRSRGL
jgi:hypothetical protein